MENTFVDDLTAVARIDSVPAILEVVCRTTGIGFLGHDLRSPLAAIDAGSMALGTMEIVEKATPVVALIQRSAARMAGLIDNVLDFARGRLGGGLSLSRADAALETTLEQVIAELRSAWPDRVIEADLALSRPIACDSARIAQLFQPFSRSSVRPGQQGLGLGLYIASEIARAHGGSLEVVSTPEETRFTCLIPL
jgi:signal transduction histidine kinase